MATKMKKKLSENILDKFSICLLYTSRKIWNWNLEEIAMKSLFEQMGGTYMLQGDYYLPTLTLPAEENKPMGY